MALTVEAVQAALKGLIDPNTQIDFVSAKSVKNLKVDGGDISLDIVLGYPAKSQFDAIRKSVIAVLRELPEVKMSALMSAAKSLRMPFSVASSYCQM